MTTKLQTAPPSMADQGVPVNEIPAPPPHQPRRSRFLRPDTKVLVLSDGDAITVKRRLNAGEQREMFARMYYASELGGIRTNPFQAGLATVLAYLLDWNLVDEGGQVVPIKDRPAEEVAAALDNLDPDDFSEIKRAVEAHEEAVDAERAAEKKARRGGTPSSATSPSPSGSAGATSGSPS